METSGMDMKTFLGLFRGREEYFAIQGPNFYKPIKQNLSEYHLERHLNGLATFGIYVLTKDSSCYLICLDVDIQKDQIDSVDFRHPQSKFAYLKDKLLKLINILKDKLEINENAILLEDTGGRGYHIWLFFEEPIKGEDAVKIYKIIRNFTEFDFEFFPKQTSLSKNRKFGNLIKLPLGIHQSYNIKSKFFNIADTVIVFPRSFQENFKYLHNLKKISKRKVNQLLNKFKDIFINEKIEKFSEENIQEIERIYYKGELDFLLKKCNALFDLKQKAEKGVELTNSEMFHFTNILLSVEGSEEVLLEKVRQSYGPKFSYDYTTKEIEKIKIFHPTSCNKLIEQGICKEYCNETIKKQNRDPIRPNTNPLSFWLTPTKRKLSIKNADLIDRISDLENIKNAYWMLKKYHKNEDALFFDQFDFENFERDLDIHTRYISSFIKNKATFPFIDCLKIKIPKDVNEDHEMQYRQLAYSNVYDQVIIQSIFNIISIIFEENYQNSSYGYRFDVENLNSENTFCDWREFYPQFKNRVLELNRKPDIKYRISCDIKGYYDYIKHDILLQQIKTYIHDDYLVKILEDIVKLYKYDDGNDQGLPQGPAYARILANLYLNDFDKEVIKHTSGYVRYVDDLFLFFKDEAQAKKGLEKVVKLLKDLGLQLSFDEKKKPKVIETSNETELVKTLDSLRYGIFEEFKFIDYLDVKEINSFYTAIEKHQVSTSSITEILEINTKLPSIIYLISKDFEVSLPIKKKILVIVNYLIQNQLFYPKRLKYIFYEIIDLIREEQYDLFEFYNKLTNLHKIYFLLTLFNIYKQQRKYENELKNIAINSLESDDLFLKGFSIIIIKELDLYNHLLRIDFLNKVLSCDSYFPRLKLFQSIKFFDLPSELKSIFDSKLSYQNSYLERKYFLSNLYYRGAEYKDNKFLLNLTVSDGHLLLAECCKLFSTIKDENYFFSELEDFIIKYPMYKSVSVNYLKYLLFENYIRSNEAVLDNLIQLYGRLKDNEIKRELINVLNRIRKAVIPSKEEFYKEHNRIDEYNECFFFEKLDGEVTVNHYVELIPYDKLKSYQFDDLNTFKNNLADLSLKNTLPDNRFEYDSKREEVFIKYSIPESFKEINHFTFLMDAKDLLSLFEIIEDLFKKAEYFYNIFKIVPLINTKNILLKQNSTEVLFKNFGTILCPNYTINSIIIRNNDPKEIPKMISFLLQDILFQNDEKKIRQFNESSKIGMTLFLSHLFKRMASEDSCLRYSYPRYKYLIEKIKNMNIESSCGISLLYFNEQLKSNLYIKNQRDIQWINICAALNKYYEDLAITYDSVNFDDIEYSNKFFMNYSYPRKLHRLSAFLLNLSLNIDKNLKNISEDRYYVSLFDLINYFAIFCIEMISFFKVGIKSSAKITQSISFDNKTTIRMDDFILNLDINDIKIINILFTMDRNDQDIFDRSLGFSLTQISSFFLLKVFSLNSNDSTFMICNNGELAKKHSDILAHNLLLRLPNIEREVTECVKNVLSDLITNQDFELSQEGINIKKEILSICQEINRIRKKLKYKRYYGKNTNNKRWPPEIYCRNTAFNIFKADDKSLSMLPLINTFPSTSVKCSWDVACKKVINVLIPNERIKKLEYRIKKGNFFGYRLKYLYSEKAKLIWDILLIAITVILVIMTFNKNCVQAPVIFIKAFCWLLRFILGSGAIFFIVKSIKDMKYWSKNIYRMIEYLRS